ncbi:DUF72 domain-containing protein [Frateuria sp. STR12]|uniref:DUF72 domain-containing protein n=1 Tax=Frateuria hangzhouensis TaxID=2995589 RepID=UPI002260C2F0|nr:DUF72 domain-containing protein [Frateuria sp. STR12]MCX7514400.1 DUF72 domain-containing protein [Frateuria sp. STR12]
MGRPGLDVRVGCAGWAIPKAHAGDFPVDGSTLERYAQVFDCAEVNSSFYRPHRPATWRRWAASVPGHFRFAAKMPKAISHECRLRACDGLVTAFLDQVGELEGKLGWLLLQLPPSLVFDPAVALPFLERLRERYDGPLACEPRHPTWFCADVDRALRSLRVSRVAADPARVPRAALPGGDRSRVYLRLHGSPRTYYDAYPPTALTAVAGRLRRWPPAWCIFDNTALGHATANALDLKRLLAEGTRPFT